MRFGVFDHLDKNDLPLADYYAARLSIIEAYERNGFDSYHCAEHHLSPIGMAPSPSVFLAAVAERTRRLRFGPMIYALPLYHPLRLLEEICMLDQLSRGRLEIGFGRGASAAELRYFGRDPKHAQSEYDAALAYILTALEERSVSVPVPSGDGERRMPLQLEPVQRPHPPLWYGVHSVASAERAARRGLNLISLDTAAETRSYVEAYRAVWRETHGAAAALPWIGFNSFLVVASTDAIAMDRARRAYARWHASFYYTSRTHGYEVFHMRPAAFDDMIKLGKAVAGTPRTVAAALRDRLVESGANLFVGQFAFGDLTSAETLESIELFAREVKPALADIR